MLPAYFANMAPVMMKNTFRFLAKPIDLNLRFMGKPLFGKNKTFRGLIFAVIFAMIIFYIQKTIGYNSIIDYSQYSLWLGFLLGFGAIIGDLVESFFKRQLNISSGKPWIPFDQIDFVLGALFFSLFVFLPTWQAVVTIIVMSPVLHIIVNHSAYFLRIRKEKW